ncbi:hypothetical protein QWY85_17165 [Neolewinella lacunae]|uniref:Uncharacterized protein n=1 Tax=Neolewinella lacunae TaxID=1517758 RepID=A0A923TA90_9BACT|nr:hypothetical protein [Neolewinella lacunae]MBC6995908.1 hypothetical protein [Neolewinella lacunae]MDN3636399.1 hypothetical protein [Neolewinella lacunae]
MRLLILICCYSISTLPLTAQRELSLTYTGAKLIRNEHVGNEWARGVWLGDDSMLRDQPYRITSGSSYTLSVAAEEANEKYPDRGDEEISFTLSDLLPAVENGGFYLEVMVTESNGRYAGGRALWRFYFLVEE